jgi:hypothetical protein
VRVAHARFPLRIRAVARGHCAQVVRASCAGSAALRMRFRRAEHGVPTERRKHRAQRMRSRARKPAKRRALPPLRARWHAS